MEDLVRVPFFVLDCTTLFAIAPVDVDGSLRRRLSPPTIESMSIFQHSFSYLNTLVMSMTIPAPSSVVASISQVSALTPEEAGVISAEPGSLHSHDSGVLDLAHATVSAGPSGAICRAKPPVGNRR